MPDLSHKAVHQFWRDYKDPIIYRVISFMEGVEDWTMDGNPEIETALKELGKTLEDIGNIDLQQENAIINLVTHLKTGRGLRLLMCLDTAYPGAAAKVLMHAEEVSKSEIDTAGIFLKRNLVFERLRLLGRVFSPDRFKLILQTLEEGGL
ncbi:type IVB secretion system protein IcmW [Coxiella burnetii]|uniref:type IVB secretion system protein IcmW n=1 Tax=Coxiella burnetii TaxID=777 RepID=UPI000183CD9A|nr:type IVB secretion system protein IcmW [Coxiella burnetii]ACJ17802.1 IcmW [Coxiella burnetii CbuG_Q212]ATN66240.1 phosphoesterase [Coxiella burnetii]OYK86810.1 phosphoesterase [Coxiella burnetii]